MSETLHVLVALLAALANSAPIARRSRISEPGRLAQALVPGLPCRALDPE